MFLDAQLLDHAGVEAGDRHGALERTLLAALAGHDDLFDVSRVVLLRVGGIAFVGRVNEQSRHRERHSQ